MARRYGELFNFYAPFTGTLYSHFPNEGEYGDSNILFKKIGEDTINNFASLDVQVIKIPLYDSSEILHPFESRYDYWINKQFFSVVAT